GDERFKGETSGAPTRITFTLPPSSSNTSMLNVSSNGTLAGISFMAPLAPASASKTGPTPFIAPPPPVPSLHSAVFTSAQNVIIRNNTVTQSGDGIGIISGSNVRILGNVITGGTSSGVTSINGNGILFQDNVIQKNADGIVIDDSTVGGTE